MSSLTKVSPAVRDHVPRGFYVDKRTWDLRLVRDVEELNVALEDSAVADSPAEPEPRARTLPAPRRQKKAGGRVMRMLLVEDNPGDVRLIREALAETELPCQLSVAVNGKEALNFLYRRGKHAAAPRPDLIVLDLNLPLQDGRAVLEDIKQDVDLRRIPVAVLTTSRAAQDLQRAYDLHANCYIHKRMDLDQFITVIQLLQAFWFHIVQLCPE